ncbi:MAG: phosphatase PAP2 family protein [Lactobacillus sp.]|nr:phosphatase PAP2 family protein [Lactobacillus sp.]
MNQNVNKILKIGALYLSFIVIAIAVVLHLQITQQFDIFFFQLLHAPNNLYLSFFKIITNLGMPIMTVILSFICGLILHSRQRWFLITIVLINTIGNHYFKYLFQRPRPTLPHLVTVGGYSFPSGHAVAITTFILALQIIIKQNTKKRLSLYLLDLIAILVILSRIVLQVHFPSDVLAGTILASANTLLFKDLVFDNQSITSDS